MFCDFLKSITKKQWLGLLFGVIIAILIWLQLIFIVNPSKNRKEEIKIGKYEWFALGLSILISIISWLKLVAVVG